MKDMMQVPSLGTTKHYRTKMSLSKEIGACNLWTSAVKHPKSVDFFYRFSVFKFAPIQLCASVYTSHHSRILRNGYSLLIIKNYLNIHEKNAPPTQHRKFSAGSMSFFQ
jgi:hypothetical protein